MGIKPNNKNKPDIYGYEMKTNSKKITFGDFSASEYAFSTINKRTKINEYNKWDNNIELTRDSYIQYFGESNKDKNNRYSWSGSCVPIYNNWNNCGQNIVINDNKDIIIKYSYSRDKRDRKSLFPEFIKKDNICIAIWKSDKMKKHINDKFNEKGFFICKKTKMTFDTICFGKTFNFEYFINGLQNKKIIFDSGMHQKNTRNYSHFRANKDFWNNLIIEEFL